MSTEKIEDNDVEEEDFSEEENLSEGRNEFGLKEDINSKEEENSFLTFDSIKIYGSKMVGKFLVFEGCSHFRQRLICSTLSNRAIKIDNIRVNSSNPGLKDFEANFLRLLEKITNGCEIIINETGTRVTYKPGFIVGGTFVHDCGKSRSMGYFMDALICLGPFGKKPLNATLEGVTNHFEDISVDLIRTVTIPLLKRFGIESGLELKIQKRGAPPEGGGQICFKCPCVRVLNPIQLLDEGKVRRIRGIAYSTRVSPQTSNRIVDSARGILNQFHQDIFIYTDHYKGNESGLSPGFALALVAETTTGCALGAESIAESGVLPEDLGIQASKLLLLEILNRGCVDTMHQSTALLFMTLCPETISKIRLGKLTPYT